MRWLWLPLTTLPALRMLHLSIHPLQSMLLTPLNQSLPASFDLPNQCLPHTLLLSASLSTLALKSSPIINLSPTIDTWLSMPLIHLSNFTLSAPQLDWYTETKIKPPTSAATTLSPSNIFPEEQVWHQSPAAPWGVFASFLSMEASEAATSAFLSFGDVFFRGTSLSTKPLLPCRRLVVPQPHLWVSPGIPTCATRRLTTIAWFLSSTNSVFSLTFLPQPHPAASCVTSITSFDTTHTSLRKERNTTRVLGDFTQIDVKKTKYKQSHTIIARMRRPTSAMKIPLWISNWFFSRKRFGGCSNVYKCKSMYQFKRKSARIQKISRMESIDDCPFNAIATWK